MSSCLSHLPFFTKSLPDGGNERCTHAHTHPPPKYLNNTKITKSQLNVVCRGVTDGADRLPVNTDKSHGSQRDLDAVLYLDYSFLA